MLPLTSPFLTLGEYASTLRRFLGAYAPLEARIDAHASALDRCGVDWPGRRKVPLLQRDVDRLAAYATGGNSAPRGDAIPRLANGAHVMGCLYVMEGATLGGKMITRNLAQVLGIGPDSGAAFFHSYGTDVGVRWQTFCAALEHCLLDARARSDAAEAATATFRFFIDQLTPGDA